MALPSESLRREEIRKLFQYAENVVEQQTWNLSTKKRYFAYFRKNVLHATRELGCPEAITTKTLRYSHKFGLKLTPRKLISDFVSETLNGMPAAPLGAIPHTTISDLYKNAKHKVDLDLQRIIDACVKELQFWGGLRQRIKELMQQSFSDKEVRITRKFLATRFSRSKLQVERFRRDVKPDARVGLYALVAKEAQLARKTAAPGMTFPDLKTTLLDVLGGESERLKGAKMWQILVLPERMVSPELNAAFVLLLCYTGWNSHSLMNLTSDRIKEAGQMKGVLESQAEIQGYKSRTDDETPSVFLDKSNDYAIETLNLILWNLRQLKMLRVVAEDERRLWFTYTSVQCNLLKEQYIGFQNGLDNFITKHGLPKFSLDQIRSQVLIAAQLRFRNIDQTRRMAGHAGIAVTGRYLEQDIFNRINSSVNLEFQRRLEATVHFRMSEIGDCVVSMYEVERVDKELLVPIGDGASCASPNRPPDPNYLEGDYCSAATCHKGDGCTNRRLVIDADRIEEVVRKRRYYSENWKRLLENNPEAFEKYHLDRMLFTFGLYDFIQNSMYGHVLTKIQRKVSEYEVA